MIVTLITVIHVLVCIFMILVILLQAGKDAGMGAAFGGGSQTVFGGRGAGSFLGKVTAVCAAIFFMTSLTLSFSAHRGSVAEQFAPAAPSAPAGAPAPAAQTPTPVPPSQPAADPAAPPAPAAPAEAAPAAPAAPAPAPANP